MMLILFVRFRLRSNHIQERAIQYIFKLPRLKTDAKKEQLTAPKHSSPKDNRSGLTGDSYGGSSDGNQHLQDVHYNADRPHITAFVIFFRT